MDFKKNTLLEINNLTVSYPSRFNVFNAVKDLSFSLDRGEILGIVGESGAGKSTVGSAIADLLTNPGYVSGGEIILDGKNLTNLTDDEKRLVRGRDIGFIFQDPMTSLNPLFTIGDQIIEAIVTNSSLSESQAKQKAIKLLEDVGIDRAELRLKQYPHQFSGGMRQRVVIAIALSTEPKLIIADEPTTALDVSIQDQILVLIKDLCKKNNVGCIFVTHDMGVIASVADRVAVMYRSKLVEINTAQEVLFNPQHEYTKSLISAVPPSDRTLDRFPLVNFIEQVGERKLDLKDHWIMASQNDEIKSGAILEVKDLNLKFVTKDAFFKANREYVTAVNNVNFSIKHGETFGLVGESGSGKSTIARLIAKLYQPDSGQILFEGQDILKLNSAGEDYFKRSVQMVFQNPYSSLNPRMRIMDIVSEPILFHKLANKSEIKHTVSELLDYVGLPTSSYNKYPHEFSGGQRQRISVARALASRPKFLICDEPTSALDVSVQAQILNLLKDLQQELNLTMLFISHDLPVIRQMCNRIAVMQKGQIIEIKETEQLFENPSHGYTKELIQLMPRFNQKVNVG